MNISPVIRTAVRRYEPIETEGLRLFPIRVAEWDAFTDASAAITCIQQALPVRYAAMPLLSAYYLMEFEVRENGEPPVGLFYRALLFLALALRLGEEEAPEKRVRLFAPIVDRAHPSRLKALGFVRNGEEICKITPVQFQRIRPILAAQNGLELVGEDANPELIEAERDLSAKNGAKLNMDSADLLDTIAVLSCTDRAEMDQWPVLKVMNRQRVYKRVLGYLICGIGETMGTRWKHGNPYPSPFYDAAEAWTSALTPLESFAGGEGQKAVEKVIGAK